jgi:hypothetical protein
MSNIELTYELIQGTKSKMVLLNNNLTGWKAVYPPAVKVYSYHDSLISRGKQPQQQPFVGMPGRDSGS